MLQSARRRAQPNEPKPDPQPAPAPAPVSPGVVSPIVTSHPGFRNTIGLLYTDSRLSSESPAKPQTDEPEPDRGLQ
jgi:hypothetical protein